MLTAVAAALVVWSAGTANAATGWAIQATPNPADANGSELYGVSCTSATSCTAVGHYFGAGPELTLAEHWNGSTWVVQATPNPASGGALFGVSCGSATSCTAVGLYYGDSSDTTMFPLAEHWNGSTWAIQATPIPAGSTDSELYGVSCTSATSCTAVGRSQDSTGSAASLAEQWNGSRWAIQATPMAAGATYSQLDGVSCTSASRCTAVGQYMHRTGAPVTLAEHWNGSTWAVQATPNPAGSTSSWLLGVSCHTATSCTAVGGYGNSSGTGPTLAEHWNGSTWAIQATPNPAGSGDTSSLLGVSCTSSTSCTAVGSYLRPSDSTRMLAEHWNGSTWVTQATAEPASSSQMSLAGVSCTSATSCTAVGWSAQHQLPATTLAEAKGQQADLP